MTVRLLPTEKGDTYSGAGGKERERETQDVSLLSRRVERFDALTVTFAERRHRRPVGGSAAHVIEAGCSQLIGGVRFETCTVHK